MRLFLQFILFFFVQAKVRFGCDPNDLFLHKKIIPNDRGINVGSFRQNGVEFDKRGTFYRWRHSCIKQESLSKPFETETVRVHCKCIAYQCRYVVRNKCRTNCESLDNGFGSKWIQVTEGSLALYEKNNYPKCEVSSIEDPIEIYEDAQFTERATKAHKFSNLKLKNPLKPTMSLNDVSYNAYNNYNNELFDFSLGFDTGCLNLAFLNHCGNVKARSFCLFIAETLFLFFFL